MAEIIGSIMCDGGKDDDYRCYIILVNRRLMCAGYDITVQDGGYDNVEDAAADVIRMYGFSTSWGLELNWEEE